MAEVCQYGLPGAPAGKELHLSTVRLLQHCGLPQGGVCNPAGCCTAFHSPGSGKAAYWQDGSPAAGSSDGLAGGTWSNRMISVGCAAQGLWPRACVNKDKTHEESVPSAHTALVVVLKCRINAKCCLMTLRWSLAAMTGGLSCLIGASLCPALGFCDSSCHSNPKRAVVMRSFGSSHWVCVFPEKCSCVGLQPNLVFSSPEYFPSS